MSLASYFAVETLASYFSTELQYLLGGVHCRRSGGQSSTPLARFRSVLTRSAGLGATVPEMLLNIPFPFTERPRTPNSLRRTNSSALQKQALALLTSLPGSGRAWVVFEYVEDAERVRTLRQLRVGERTVTVGHGRHEPNEVLWDQYGVRRGMPS